MLLGFAQSWAADYSIDNTCQNCTRRQLDSINAYDRRPIRVNQVGFRPQDPKHAFVANPSALTFKVVNAETGSEATSGSLISLGTVPRPGIWINGSFNSISSVYQFGDTSAAASNEKLHDADFSSLAAPGKYYVVVGADTSAVFRIDDKIYNYIFENSLKFFGVNRCGDTHSWIHGACHLKDGSGIGHDLAGGWHDCGDHFKVSETLGYSAFMLSLTYALWPDKAEDFFGKSYNDSLPFGTDGIPDLLWEAKVGVDYIFKLYKASKADGLIAQKDMYHSVGVNLADHHFWDKPERQDAQPEDKGGPDRVIAKGAGVNVVGMYAASMALFSWGWELFDKTYADSLKAAAIDLYDNVIMKNLNSTTSGLAGFYPGGGRLDDDPAAAALALWFLTKDKRFQYDLLENKSILSNPNAIYNDGEFPAGHFGNPSGFHHGGWTTDYEQIHAPVMYAFAKLILGSEATAASYGINATVRDSLLEDAVECLRKSIDNGSNGSTTIPTKNGKSIHVDKPYQGVFTSVDWGYNRYNLGMVNELFMFHDLTGEKEYFQIALDNLNYNLGMNPWDISFLMSAGDKNLQHPHNRSANPDGYNAGGYPYLYQSPKGALMGGAKPTKTLKDDWNDYTVTETCTDFSAQFILPAQMLAKDLPPDNAGPLITNVVATPISGTEAIISWDTDELAVVTIYIATQAEGTPFDTVTSQGLSKGGSVQVSGLENGKTYYFYLQGMDIRHNVSVEDNHGEWYSFKMVSNPAQIKDVRICQVDNTSAKIYWWTSNGAYNSAIKYGTSASALSQTVVGDKGQPVLFHEVLLTGLLPGTKYYFDVVSGTTTDNNAGNHYDFTTEAQAVYVDYTVTLKPTGDRNNTAFFYMRVMNNEPVAYTGLEIRFYYKTKTVPPQNVRIQTPYNVILDESGMSSAATLTKGAPVQVAGTDQWYLPMTLNNTLPVSGSAVIQMEMHNGDWGDLPFSELEGSWSLIPHTAATDPISFPGIDLVNGVNFSGDGFLEVVNGVTVEAYQRDPYITAHFNGKHIFGYPPDFASGSLPILKRQISMLFTQPFKSPQTSVEQDSTLANFAGYSWISPTGSLDLFELNGTDLTTSAVTYPKSPRKDSLTFAHSVGNLAYGPNREEFVVWHNANANASGSYDCQCAYQRMLVEVDTLVVPREKRYLRFEPSDTVRFYTGKRKLVEVRLTNEAGETKTGEDISFSLGADYNGFTFYSDPNSTVAISRITLVNGVAQFYVSYQAELTQSLITRLALVAENPKSEFMYVVVNPILVAEPPPPWPIIDQAKILDTNCDFIPDALDLTLTGDFVDGKYDFSKVEFVYEGDTLQTTNLVSQNGNVYRYAITSPSKAINTNAKGLIWLHVQVAGKGVQVSEESYQDAIGPTVLSVSILENLENNAQDSLFVQFSEPVSASMDWLFHIYDNKGVAISTEPIVVGSAIDNEDRNIWVYVVDRPQPVVEGSMLQLKEDAALLDRNGNGVSACTYPKLPVTLKRRPIPMVYASIGDEDGDGLAEMIHVEFAKSVDSLHEPDSLSAIFGFYAAETLTTGNWSWNANRTMATIDLETSFARGNTAGTYQGVYQGRSLINAGLVVQHKGLGADYESTEIIAEDKAGPIVYAASLGHGKIMDTLFVQFSEPVVKTSDSLGKVILLRERGGQVALVPMAWHLATDGLSMKLMYTEASAGYVGEGDRVRLDPVISLFKDPTGNIPAERNPWVSVTGNGTVEMKVTVDMKDKVSQGGSPAGYGAHVPAEKEYVRLSFWNAQTNRVDIIQNGEVGIANLDSASYKPQGPTLDLSIFISRGAGFGEEPVWDSVQVHVEVLYYSNMGAFVQKHQESFTLRDSRYLDVNSNLNARLEWTSRDGDGPRSIDGRKVGSGAYIAKVLVRSQMFAQRTSVPISTRVRYDRQKFSYSENRLFGFLRR